MMKQVSIYQLTPLYPPVFCTWDELAEITTNEGVLFKERDGYDALYKKYPKAGDFFVTPDGRLCVPTSGNTALFLNREIKVKKSAPVLFSYNYARDFFGKKINPDTEIRSVRNFRKKGDKYYATAVLSDYAVDKIVTVYLGEVERGELEVMSFFELLKKVVGRRIADITFNP